MNEISMGMKIIKEFEEGVFEGSVVDGPLQTYFTKKNNKKKKRVMETVWKIEYDDGDREDLCRDEILKLHQDWLDHDVAEEPVAASVTTAASVTPTDSTSELDTAVYDTVPPSPDSTVPTGCWATYETAKKDLSAFPNITEAEVEQALQQMSPPYGYNAAMQLIQKAKNGPPTFQEDEPTRFFAGVGLRIRKYFAETNKYHSGKVVSGPTWVETDGDDEPIWKVEYDDNDQEDMDTNDLYTHWVGHIPHTSRLLERELYSLEVFSGCGIVTQQFCLRQWHVMSIDSDPESQALMKVDIMKLRYHHIGRVPDFLWFSPPCFTYSLMACGKHRHVDSEQWEKTPQAHEHNRYFVQMLKIINWAKKLHPHLIVVIENPRGLMRKMPLMKEFRKSFGLYETTVDYCAFGEDYQKPTLLWTNDFGLHSKLGTYRCKEGSCPYGRGSHPRNVQEDSSTFNVAAIPRALAKEVAWYVDCKMYENSIHRSQPVTLTKEQEEEFDRLMSSEEASDESDSVEEDGSTKPSAAQGQGGFETFSPDSVV